MHIRHYLQSDETLRQRAKCRCVLFLGIVLSGIATPAAAQIGPSTPVTLLQDILWFVVVAALLMAAILALVAVLLWYRERKPRAKSDPHSDRDAKARASSKEPAIDDTLPRE